VLLSTNSGRNDDGGGGGNEFVNDFVPVKADKAKADLYSNGRGEENGDGDKAALTERRHISDTSARRQRQEMVGVA
jgi:hypothetical protein